jgi:RHS repeat-associated protein
MLKEIDFILERSYHQASEERAKFLQELIKRKESSNLIKNKEEIATHWLEEQKKVSQGYLLYIQKELLEKATRYRLMEEKKRQELKNIQEGEKDLLFALQEDAPLEEEYREPKSKNFSEEELRKSFFSSQILLKAPDFFALKALFPRVIPLDGQKQSGPNYYLSEGRTYRFLVQSKEPLHSLQVKLKMQDGTLLEESITFPKIGTFAWEKSLVEGGFLFHPKLFSLGESIAISIMPVYDGENTFSLVLGIQGWQEGLELFIYEKDALLCSAIFHLPLPRKLSFLEKPSLFQEGIIPSFHREQKEPSFPEVEKVEKAIEDPILVSFVEELKKDPLLLFQYVYNEIALVGFLPEKAPICRDAAATFLDKKGSCLEQCNLLVELLRLAGYNAWYAEGPCEIPSSFCERLFLVEFPQEQNTTLHCPWVVFQLEEKKISLFPWMKSMQIQEGYDLYSFMPPSYATAELWIQKYLLQDEAIMKHIGVDGDDTAGTLFIRFVQEQLQSQGLSLEDVGCRHTCLQRQFSSWKECPRPAVVQEERSFMELDPSFYTPVTIEVSVRSGDLKRVVHEEEERLSSLKDYVAFFSFEKDVCLMEQKGHVYRFLVEHEEDLVEVCLTWKGNTKSFSLKKGSTGVFYFHKGGSSTKSVEALCQKWQDEGSARGRMKAFLTRAGSAYFTRCSLMQRTLQILHKALSSPFLGAGFIKITPSYGSNSGVFPQIDTQFFVECPLKEEEKKASFRQCLDLMILDSSSWEHRVLQEAFEVPHAISAVKLLQIAQENHKKEGKEGLGFFTLSKKSFFLADKGADVSNTLFPHISYPLSFMKQLAPLQWEFLRKEFEKEGGDFVIAYLTPGPVASRDEEDGPPSYTGIGALVLGLPSSRAIMTDGSLAPYVETKKIKTESYKKHPLLGCRSEKSAFLSPCKDQENPPSSLDLFPTSDVRPALQTRGESIADPVDIITGAFYIDEVDLTIPGIFPIEIRRNYSSRSDHNGALGFGWSLNIHPYLREEKGLRYVTEMCGSVIAYRFNVKTNRWEVLPEDNPSLWIDPASSKNLYHNYMVGEVLYGYDGSKRVFSEKKLLHWIHATGNFLQFLYKDDLLVQIVSSSGSFCDFTYDLTSKRIVEISVQDGRNVRYEYDLNGDLRRVSKVAGKLSSYTYDEAHRVIALQSPSKDALYNTYDQHGRITEQKELLDATGEKVVTAQFSYTDGKRVFTDAAGFCTTYFLFQNQIYKIVDPLGNAIFQSWYLSKDTALDPYTGQVVSASGYSKGLKFCVDKRGLKTSYDYDAKGNMVKMLIEGKDLTGAFDESIVKKFFYNENNLCIRKELLTKSVVTTYDEAFCFLPKRVEEWCNGVCTSYSEWEYDERGQVILENISGRIAIKERNAMGLVSTCTQKTGTQDPDLVTHYEYNRQGQCIYQKQGSHIQQELFDLAGNKIFSCLKNKEGKVLDEWSAQYNAQDLCVWRQGIHPDDALFYDYDSKYRLQAFGYFKKQRAPEAMYVYNSANQLVEEVDARGYSTYYTYNGLGKISSKTKEGSTYQYEYESGGKISKIIAPNGGETEMFYTTNGLLKEEIFPDGTQNFYVYDLLGRIIEEKRGDLVWKVLRNDKIRSELWTEQNTGMQKRKVFDAHGQILREMDPSGQTTVREYDLLGRKVLEKRSQEVYRWSYEEDQVTCYLPNQEMVVTRYELGEIAQTKTLDAQGKILSQKVVEKDRTLSKETIFEGDLKDPVVTTVYKDVHCRPIIIEKGGCSTIYEYDLCGNCLRTTHPSGFTIEKSFDGLGRMTSKTLEDGSTLFYRYDKESNLVEYELFDDPLWSASYDLAGRMVEESLHGVSKIRYRYDKGRLVEKIDPNGTSHFFEYDLFGNLISESTGDAIKTYSYDSLGRLVMAAEGSSKIERSYDELGHLCGEKVFLEGKLLSELEQTVSPALRALKISSHERTMIYQNGAMIQILSPEMDIQYEYDTAGRLVGKKTPYGMQSITYNAGSLPEKIEHVLLEKSFSEKLSWTFSHKISTHTADFGQVQEKRYCYTPRGFLLSDQEGLYSFTEKGSRLKAPHWAALAFDALGRVTQEHAGKKLIGTIYDELGQVTQRGDKKLQWDSFGHLISVQTQDLSWEAFYDALGRRLTHVTKIAGKDPLVVTSFYDPEDPLQEIGVAVNGKTFWKVYGPSSCEAVIDEDTHKAVFLLQDALGHLQGVVSDEVLFLDERCGSYGPLEQPSYDDVDSYAKSLLWKGHLLEPTGFIYIMGRYYDPISGNFLSPNPAGYPFFLDLYGYQEGDPINK